MCHLSPRYQASKWTFILDVFYGCETWTLILKGEHTLGIKDRWKKCKLAENFITKYIMLHSSLHT
jgi:hypothetical protein